MSLPARALLAIIFALGATGCSHSSGATPLAPSAKTTSALAAAMQSLFSDDDGLPGPPRQSPVVRSRQATVNVGVVGFGTRTPAERIGLNLFADARYTAVFDHAADTGISSVWFGTIEGVAGSDVVLTVSAGVFAATVTMPNAYYSVMPSDGGRVLVAQIDRSAMLPPG